MQPIAGGEPLRAGDVLHHPAFGFATALDTDERGASLRILRDASPKRVSRHALHTSWRRCRPGGVLARHVAEPEAVRALGSDDPVALLGLLLADLGGDQPLEHLHDWMKEILGGHEFDRWWAAAVPLAALDDRLHLDGGVLSLAEGVRESDFHARTATATPGAAAAVPAPAPAPAPAPVPAPTDTPEALWGSIRALAEALAALHVRGATLLRNPDRVRRTVTGWELDADSEPAPPEHDVHWLCRHWCAGLVGGRLPEAVDSNALVDALPIVQPALPPELLGVLRYALAASTALRPADGVALAAQLAAAESQALARRRLPPRRSATLRAGFDTHIGTLKALTMQANQDAFVLLGEPDLALFAVADGISTCSAGSGDLASSLCIRTLRLQWAVHSTALRAAVAPGGKDAVAHEGAAAEAVDRFLAGALDRANRVICDAALRVAGGDLSQHVPMGTTVVVGVAWGDRVQIAALGDSRAWVVGRHGVAPLLYDQNLDSLRLRDAAAGGAPDWDEDGHALVGYLGHFDALGEPTLPPPFLRSFRLMPDEWLILASDGLSDHAADEEAGVYRILERSVALANLGGLPGVPTPPPGRGSATADNSAARAMALARQLVLAANEGGGGDNITVLALTLSRDAGGPSPAAPVAS